MQTYTYICVCIITRVKVCALFQAESFGEALSYKSVNFFLKKYELPIYLRFDLPIFLLL